MTNGHFSKRKGSVIFLSKRSKTVMGPNFSSYVTLLEFCFGNLSFIMCHGNRCYFIFGFCSYSMSERLKWFLRSLGACSLFLCSINKKINNHVHELFSLLLRTEVVAPLGTYEF